MNKQELIKKYEGFREIWNNPGSISALECFLRDLAQLDEPQKPTIPQFVADYIALYKSRGYTLFDAMDSPTPTSAVGEYLEDNLDTFARAWLDCYEVDKEKLYTVEIPNVYHNSLGYYHLYNNLSFYNKGDAKDIRFELTEAEIKSVDERLWQFAKEVE